MNLTLYGVKTLLVTLIFDGYCIHNTLRANNLTTGLMNGIYHGTDAMSVRRLCQKAKLGFSRKNGISNSIQSKTKGRRTVLCLYTVPFKSWWFPSAKFRRTIDSNKNRLAFDFVAQRDIYKL